MPKQTTDEENLSLSFFAISDLHVARRRGGKAYFMRQAAWKWLEAQSFAFGLFAGDVTNSAEQDEFDQAWKEMSKIAAPLLVAYGNHDYAENNERKAQAEEIRLAFRRKMAGRLADEGVECSSVPGLLCWACRIKGIQIIILECADSYPNTQVGEEQLNWLDTMLKKSDGDRFRVVVNHFPITGHVPGMQSKKQISYIRDSKKLKTILEAHERILYFAGHTHATLYSEENNCQFDEQHQIAYINTASIGNAMPDAQRIRQLKQMQRSAQEQEAKQIQAQIDDLNQSGSMGICVDVCPDSMRLYGVDFLNGQKIERCAYKLHL